MFRCYTLYMATNVLNGVSSASSLFFERVGGLRVGGRGYEKAVAGTWEHKEKWTRTTEQRSPWETLISG